MRRRVAPFVTTLAAVGVLAAGCGVSDEGPLPGVAAEVDSESLALAEVDDAVEEYCLLREENPEATAAPRASIRSQFVQGWTQAVAAEQLAGDYDLPPPAESIDRAVVEETWGELGTIDDDNYEAFEFLTWIQLRLTTTVEAIGTEDLRDDPAAGEPAVDRGVSLVQEWLADNDPRYNPVLGELDAETGLFTGDALSVPVSGEAEVASSAELTEQQVAALPAGQRCGPEAAPIAPIAPAPGG